MLSGIWQRAWHGQQLNPSPILVGKDLDAAANLQWNQSQKCCDCAEQVNVLAQEITVTELCVGCAGLGQPQPVMLQGTFGLVGESSWGAPGGVRWCKSASCEQRLKMGPIHPRKLKKHTLVMYKAERRTGQGAMGLYCGGEIQVPPEKKTV